jgi:hypothetical protein
VEAPLEAVQYGLDQSNLVYVRQLKGLDDPGAPGSLSSWASK